MEKKYEKLSTDQFKEFVQFLPTLFAFLREANHQIASVHVAKFESVMTGEYGSYSQVYELSLNEHLALLIGALNRHAEVQAIASSSDPQETLLAELRAFDQVEDKPHNNAFEQAYIMAWAYSLGRTIESMARYGRSISSLLQDVRDNHNNDSLFKAIRMDRTVIGTPTAMKSIARAQLRNNKAFFKNLRSALAGPSKKEWTGLDQMRYAFVLLREIGISDLSEAVLEELMVDTLQVYPRGKGDARKALRAHYRRSRQIPSI